MGTPSISSKKEPNKSAIVEAQDIYKWYLTTMKIEQRNIQAEISYIKRYVK